MDELKSCPFCGSNKLKIDKKSKLVGRNGLDWNVYQQTYSVRCNVCHARGGAIGGKVIPHYEFFLRGTPLDPSHRPEWLADEKDLIAKAIELWNVRATDG